MISRIPTACLGAALLCLPWLTVHAADLSCVAGTQTAYTTPTPVRLTASPQEPIDYSSVHGTATPDGQIVLSDDVTVHMGDRELQADKATIDTRHRTVRVDGAVRYSDPLVSVQGDTGLYSDTGAQFGNARFTFLKQPGRGTAHSIELTPDGKLQLLDVTYTTCPPGHSDWQLRARSISLDTQAGRGIGRGARVEFKGIPLIYLPWLSFPLSNARQSGFLFPSIGTSTRSGVILSTPWYWNIAPNSDLTFTPTVYSNRGVDAGVEYRLLTATNSGTLQSNYLQHDHVFGSERSYVQLLDRLQLPSNWRLETNAQNVSDTSYFEDFAQGSEGTSIAFLPRLASLRHRDDIWNINAQLLNFQTLDNNLAAADRPYTQLPRMTAGALWHVPRLGGLVTSMDSELVDFTRNNGVTGWRLDARPQLSYDWTRPGYFVRPSVAWEFTQYALANTGGADSSPQRNLPILVLDSGLQFERQAGSHGVQSVTLEPRLMYVYIPYRDQSQLPVFDTATPDANLIELFQPNRYIGLDRIGDTNAVTLGLTTHLFESASGLRYLSATIGQSIYLAQPRVTLPGSPVTQLSSSSLIAEVELTAYRNWNLQFDAASSPDADELDKAQVHLQYRASGNRVANVGYSYQRGQLQQTDVSVAWPISTRWDAYARSVYSLQDHTAIEHFVGFQFRGACWGLRAVARRSVTSRTGQQDTGFYLQLELNGLSSVGTGADAFLKQSIRGYSSTPTSP